MTSTAPWLGDRRPEAPDDLAARVLERVRGPGDGSGERADLLLAAARISLHEALDRPGRVRGSAFELLVADALATYACEAALESERPREALERVVEVGRRA